MQFLARSHTMSGDGTVPLHFNFYQDNNFKESISPSSLAPSIPVKIHLALTIVFTTLYGLLFFLIFVQLLLILYYKHRRFSYQTVFLFAALLWAALRTTLFSFYFRNCSTTNRFGTFSSWFLFAFPVFLQYFMLNVLLLYFVKVVMKARNPNKPNSYRKRITLGFLIVNGIFLITNVTSSVLYCQAPEAHYQQTITIVRVTMDYSLFLFSALGLCFCIIKLKLQRAQIFLEGQGLSLLQSTVTCTFIALLYLSRAVYNIIAVSPVNTPTFNFGWINVSDQAKVTFSDTYSCKKYLINFGYLLNVLNEKLGLLMFICTFLGEIGRQGSIEHYTKNYAYVSFGVVLVIWELLPTFITVWFFRVRRPPEHGMTSAITSNSFNSKSYFFDNPRRYDSDDDLSIAYTPPRPAGLLDIPGMGSPRSYSVNDRSSFKRVSNYGSIPTLGSRSTPHSHSYHSPYVRGTTPPLLFTSSRTDPYKTIPQEMD